MHRPSVFRPSSSRVAIALLAWLLLSCGPSDPLAEVRQLQAAGDFAGSIEPLRELLADNRGDPEIQFLYGTALAMTGETSLAEWSLREAMNHPDWLLPAGTRLAMGALRTRNFPAAIETTTRLLEAHPDEVALWVMRANAYAHSRSDPEAALADVDRVLELDPDNIDVMEPRILSLLALERIDEAAEAIEALGDQIDETQLGPSVPGWHCATTALFAEESGELELAEERWQRCVEHYPAHPNVVTNALSFYDGRMEFDRSLAILRAAQAEDPASRLFRVQLAERLRAGGKQDEAEALMRAATEGEDANLVASAWVDLAKHYQAVGAFPAAARAVERAVALSESLGGPPPQLQLELADALLLAGELDQALAAADEMTLEAHREMIRARVAQRRGQHAEAIEHFGNSFQLWPDNPWARYFEAFSAEALGDFDRASEAYRYSIRIAPGATDSRQRLARLHMAEGRDLDAQTMLRIKFAEAPLDLDGELLSVRLWARLGAKAPLEEALAKFQHGLPSQWGPALAAAAEGRRDRAGSEAAVEWLRSRESQGVDFADPSQAAALRVLVRYAGEAGVATDTEELVRAAVAAHPEGAEAHEILGLCLESIGDRVAKARESYERALELDANNAGALAGLARLALAEDPARALSLFDRAIAANPLEVGPKLGAARALVVAGRPEQAEERLGLILEEHPYHAAAAARLAELRLTRGDHSDETLALARRALRFGGGEQAAELVRRVESGPASPDA